MHLMLLGILIILLAGFLSGEIAEDYRVDYIYMGKHNYPAYEKVLVGETSRSVIQNSLIPVILIEQEMEKTELKVNAVRKAER